ncbi:MAG: endolytic transglycosylase MltG [Candidatus Aminicenantales bacterium]
MRRLLKIVQTLLLSSLVFLLILSVWLSLDTYRTATNATPNVFFKIEKGKGIKAIAQSLKEKGILQKKWPFLFRYELFYYPKSLKAGEYLFTSFYSTQEILNTLTLGKVYLHPLTIAEGWTGQEITAYLTSSGFGTEEDFRAAFMNPEIISSWDQKAWNLEGYLFPETYYLSLGQTSEEIFLKIVNQFQSVFAEPWRRRTAEMGMTIREVVTLASLIEKEASLSEEKKRVSAVFHNRIKQRMKLDCDPTIIYVLKQNGLFEGRLRSKDLRLDSPYNTYLYAGLPPSPICNPGKESLEAALYPAKENYFYFVSRNDGSHHFSRSFREHQLAVKKYQKRR